MDEPFLPEYAQKRMRERSVTDDDVKWALRRPVGDPAPGQPGSVWIEGYASGNRILRVCVRIDDHNYVITVAWKET